ncbi:MAG: PEP-CTERM sorting domain-containing protein [Planctomycetota bacterium]
MFRKASVSLSVIAWCFCGQAEAGTITAPESVLSEPPVFPDFAFDLTIDQSGLSANYVRGVTDFDSYIAGSPTHMGEFAPPNFGAADPETGIVDYDMGSSMTMTRLVLWQYPFPDVGPILDFDVYTSNDATFAISTFVGSFTAIADGTFPLTPNGAQVFDLTDSTARYFRIDVQSSTSDPSSAFGWSEIAVEAVPEPASALLVCSGLAMCAARLRRRNS